VSKKTGKTVEIASLSCVRSISVWPKKRTVFQASNTNYPCSSTSSQELSREKKRPGYRYNKKKHQKIEREWSQNKKWKTHLLRDLCLGL